MTVSVLLTQARRQAAPYQQQMQPWQAAAVIISTLLACLHGAAAVVDPCSEPYPGLGTDFVTTQYKVQNGFLPNPHA